MNKLDKMFKAFAKDGGEWRKVVFWTKSNSDDVFTALHTLDGLAQVSIFKNDASMNPPTPPNTTQGGG